MATNFTEDQIDTLWREAGRRGLTFLAELCERWLDGEGAARQSTGETIRAYIKGSKIAALIA